MVGPCCYNPKRNNLFIVRRNSNSGIGNLFSSRATKSHPAEGFDFYGREDRRAGFDDSRKNILKYFLKSFDFKKKYFRLFLFLRSGLTGEDSGEKQFRIFN